MWAQLASSLLLLSPPPAHLQHIVKLSTDQEGPALRSLRVRRGCPIKSAVHSTASLAMPPVPCCSSCPQGTSVMSTPCLTRLCIAEMQNFSAAHRNSAISALTWQPAPVDSFLMTRECAGFSLCLLRLSAPLHCVVAPKDHAAGDAPAGCRPGILRGAQLCLPISCSGQHGALACRLGLHFQRKPFFHNFPVHNCR